MKIARAELNVALLDLFTAKQTFGFLIFLNLEINCNGFSI